MLRATSFALLACLTLFACTEDRTETQVLAVNRHTGQQQSFPDEASVPEGWTICPPGSDCPELLPCDELDEAACLARDDCEAIYEETPCASPLPCPLAFAGCKAAGGGGGTCDAGDPGGRPDAGGVCAMEGESCTTTPCCEGTWCCAGVPVPPGAEYCSTGPCPISDRNVKEGFQSVDADEVLRRLVALPLAKWSYVWDPGTEHLGPMAQDFKAAFGLGPTDRMIFQLDADGVAFASIQALHRRLETVQAENEALERRLRELEQRLEATSRR